MELKNAVRNWAPYDDGRKRQFQNAARAALKRLANALNLAPGSFDLRANAGGIAVSGEVTLHAENVYVQVSISYVDLPEILWRTCNGRKDYTGGPNNFAPAAVLDDAETTAALSRAILRAVGDAARRAGTR